MKTLLLRKLSCVLITSLIGLTSVSSANANCILKANKSPQFNMWWQGINAGSPNHKGRVKFEFVAASDLENAVFKGRFESGAIAYNIERATIKGNEFYFKTTTFDRQGRTGRESYIVGTGKCGKLGILGEFHYVDEDPKATIYRFNFGMSIIPSGSVGP